MKHTKNKGTNSSNNLSPSKGKGDRGKGKGSADSSASANIKTGSKDKDRRDSAGNSEKELRGDAIDLKDCPLRLPEFANVDHGKLVPRYTSGETKNPITHLSLLPSKFIKDPNPPGSYDNQCLEFYI